MIRAWILVRLLTVKCGYLKASENLLDARFEVSQAEPALAIGPLHAIVLSTPAVLQR